MRFATLMLAAGFVLLSMPMATATVLLPSDAGSAGSADSCAPDPCGTLNAVCRKALHADCVRLASTEVSAETVHCMGVVCKTINEVCLRVLGARCLG